MSRLVSLILLAVLMIPVAGMVYFCVLIFAMQMLSPSSRQPQPWLAAGMATWLFMAAYWLMLWGQRVTWTSRRISLTLGAAFAAIVVGGILGTFVYMAEREVGYFVGTATAPLAWIVAATVVWRESAGERGKRMATTGADALVCPACAYSMTGLHEARCPECGVQYTLDELFAAQPGREKSSEF